MHRRHTGWVVTCALAACLSLAASAPGGHPQEAGPRYRSPNAVVLSPDGLTVYVVSQTSASVLAVDLQERRVAAEWAVGAFPTDAAISPDGRWLYVTDLYDRAVRVLDLQTGEVTHALPAGFEPYGLALSADGHRLHVGNSISATVSTVDVAGGEVLAEVAVGAGPRHVALADGGRRLVSADRLARGVTILDPATGDVLETRRLGRASLLHEVACDPDSSWCFVAHLVAHDEEVTTQIDRGWINSNALSIIDLDRPGHRVPLLLDTLLRGGANPWGVALDPAGRWVFVTLAGVHELAIVDRSRAMEIVRATTDADLEFIEEDVGLLERTGFARRVPTRGNGPRGVAFSEALQQVVVGNYFSEDLSLIDPVTGEVTAIIPLGERQPLTDWRRGEMHFSDARFCHQAWYSCASCHQEDASMDGLSWDLTNDGKGNPKNAKSLRDAADTPPSMWSGVRAAAADALMGGMRFQGFLPDPAFIDPVREFVFHPRRMPNAYAETRPEAVERGRLAYEKADCHRCHPAPLYTDLRMYDLGLREPFEQRDSFDTPSLRECYRTAPYLHHGGAATLEEVFTVWDPDGRHGTWQQLTDGEFADMITFTRSL